MQCVTSDASGVLSIANPQPADISTCTFVIGNYSEQVPDLLRLDEQGGIDIAVAVLGLLAVAYVFRALARAINSTDDPYER